ncbi:MAG: PAS domain S-box protein [Ignavibacteriales bacterium]|nr:PAS domain S-box protein [Ignavibacteriales bacterium]
MAKRARSSRSPKKSMDSVAPNNVSDALQAEERIRRYERMLRRGEQLAGMGSWHWDVASNTVIWSDELYNIYGINSGTPLTYETFLDRVHPGDRERVRAVVSDALKQQKPFRYEERIIRPDGKVRILDSQGDIELDKNAQVSSLFGFCRDVTEERLAQRDIKEREERFAKIFHASPIATILTTLTDERILDINARFQDLTGFNRNELLGSKVSSFGLWPSSDERRHLVAELLEKGALREVKLVFKHRDGRGLQVLGSIELVEIGGRDCLLILVWRG